jgi:hypothetical protein
MRYSHTVIRWVKGDSMGKRQCFVAVLLMFLVAACGDTAERVDEAVKLLQDIEQNGTWEQISDGLDALEDQSYEAAVQLREDDEDITVNLQVDADQNMLAQVTTNGTTQEYFVDGSHIYRVEQGHFACVTRPEESHLVSARTIFENYILAAPGIRLSSMADDTDEETVAGREATRYELVSRMTDALKVLEKFDNDKLRASVEQAGAFELTGDLVLDDETAALLRYNSTYHNGKLENVLTFEVTSWGDVPDLTGPAESAITSPCE